MGGEESQAIPFPLTTHLALEFPISVNPVLHLNVAVEFIDKIAGIVTFPFGKLVMAGPLIKVDYLNKPLKIRGFSFEICSHPHMQM